MLWNASRFHKSMAALASYLMSLIRDPPPVHFPHSLGLPLPPVMHQILSEEYLNGFNEIFVIGDVHGCYDEMMALLHLSRAMSDDVLKIFVGDLVNKGPKSCEVVDMVRKRNSILCVRGNHDEVVLKEYMLSRQPSYQLSAKNKWINNLSAEDITYLNSLPYTITIPSLQAVIVHAGLVPGKSINCVNPAHYLTLRNLIEPSDCFWDFGIQPTKNGNIGRPWASLWPGPQHIYFGHDAKRMLQQYLYATGLDTGCVYGNSLTGVFISGMRKGAFFSVRANQVYCPVGGS